MPAKAGIQRGSDLDSGVRRNDDRGRPKPTVGLEAPPRHTHLVGNLAELVEAVFDAGVGDGYDPEAGFSRSWAQITKPAIGVKGNPE